jgi:hypothetical protein
MKIQISAALTCWLLLLGTAAVSTADRLDIQNLPHGWIITDETRSNSCAAVTITGNKLCDPINPNPPDGTEPTTCPPADIVIFDTEQTGTSDTDLQRRDPPRRTGWSGGNQPADTIVGNGLIIMQIAVDSNGDNIVDDPDDDDDGGWICLNFSQPIVNFGFTAVDIDDGGNACCIRFYGDGVQAGRILFNDFITRDGVIYGDNTINRIAPITPQDVFNLDSSAGGATLVDNFDRVCFRNRGSGLITDVNFDCETTSVPTLSEWGMILLALIMGTAAIIFMRRHALAG